MSQSVDSSMLRENLNLERNGQLGGTPSHTARPRTLFYSNRWWQWLIMTIGFYVGKLGPIFPEPTIVMLMRSTLVTLLFFQMLMMLTMVKMMIKRMKMIIWHHGRHIGHGGQVGPTVRDLLTEHHFFSSTWVVTEMNFHGTRINQNDLASISQLGPYLNLLPYVLVVIAFSKTDPKRVRVSTSSSQLIGNYFKTP